MSNRIQVVIEKPVVIVWACPECARMNDVVTWKERGWVSCPRCKSVYTYDPVEEK